MSREMKESGIKFVGKIPVDWMVIKNKYLFTENKKFVGDEFRSYQLLSLTTKGVKKKDIENPNGKLPESFSTYQQVKRNNLILCLFDLDLSAVFSGVSSYEGMISPAYKVLSYNYDFDSDFVDFWFRNIGYTRSYILYSKSLRSTINNDNFKEIYSVYPSIYEQKKIANYLNNKIGSIESIIERTQSTIENYKLLKQSVITEALTKGLDKNAEMKDTGIEWIGEIPIHWNTVSIGTLFSSVLGKMVTDIQKDDTYSFEKYLSAINVHFDGVNLAVEKHMWFSPREKELYLLKKGDLLVVEGGAGAGGASLFNYDGENSYYIQNSIHLVRPKTEASRKFLYYWLYSLVTRGYIEYCSNKATIPHFTKEKLLSTPMCFVSRSEQDEIVKYLDEMCMKIDVLIQQKQKLTDDLVSYRKSLIYEYITGKKEVL